MAKKSWKRRPKSFHQLAAAIDERIRQRNRLKGYCRLGGSFIQMRDPCTHEGMGEKCESCGDSCPHNSWRVGSSPMDKESLK